MAHYPQFSRNVSRYEKGKINYIGSLFNK